MLLEEIKERKVIRGIVPNADVKIISVERSSPDVITVYYKQSDGKLGERQLFRADEAKYSLVEKHFSFKGNAADFKLAMEAKRISNAHLFDPYMAIHTSNVIPLPHQITAVYESMLPKQPLRFILADDPGAGKTIMAGLLIKELIARADAERILIVSPGSLVEQWRDELDEKFNLKFRILSHELSEQCSGNVFNEYNLLIARIDQLKRMEEDEDGNKKHGEFWRKLEQVTWDLVIIDEAHKLSAHFSGDDIKKSNRFRLGETLSARAKHFLMMTATPHNGKEEEFQLFLSLLDGDRFGRIRGSVEEVNTSDIMRRMCKEELVKFDGKPLFPERRAISVTYQLSDDEMYLYEDVTRYVCEEMNKAEKLQGDKRGSVGFALTSLQRRLASSPEAIYKSLESRKKRLEEKLTEWEKLSSRGGSGYVSDVLQPYHKNSIFFAKKWGDGDDDAEDLTGEEYEREEQWFTDRATASLTISELKKEIETLEKLRNSAHRLVQSKQDRKWEELRRVLDDPLMHDKDRRRKLIIFTEYRATLDYLQDRISDFLGDRERVRVIHGGLNRESRRQIQEEFRNIPDVQVLIATDAAGEGVNLQNAHLMINYDLPWNPNRIEQRFGRIHRIGQTEVCYLWNLIAVETREGAVFAQLFEKLEQERLALGGKVFDILGDIFEETSLEELLLDAIRYGEDPKRKEELDQIVKGALDKEHIEALIKKHALTRDFMTPERAFEIRDEMEMAEARKLQPYYVRDYFLQAFSYLQGSLVKREAGRYQIKRVPAVIISKNKQMLSSGSSIINPVVKEYERVCFDKKYVDDRGKQAVLLHPGHPLMSSLTACILDQLGGVLQQGSVLVSDAGLDFDPYVICVLDHKIVDQNAKTISRRFQFVRMNRDGTKTDAGFAPHIDLRPLTDAESAVLSSQFGKTWLDSLSQVFLNGADLGWAATDVESGAVSYANSFLVPEHLAEVKRDIEADVEKAKIEVRRRLQSEIDYLVRLRMKFEEGVEKGIPASIPSLEKTKQEINRVETRMAVRLDELDRMRDVVSQSPVLVGACLVLPKGCIDALTGDKGKTEYCTDEKLKRQIELSAMKAVMDKEVSMGYTVSDVSKLNCGWDVTSRRYAVEDGKTFMIDERHIEVKGKGAESPVVTVSRNEYNAGLNQAEKFVLAIVKVDGESVSRPYYVHHPFTKELTDGVTSINLDIDLLLEKSEEF